MYVNNISPITHMKWKSSTLCDKSKNILASLCCRSVIVVNDSLCTENDGDDNNDDVKRRIDGFLLNFSFANLCVQMECK